MKKLHEEEQTRTVSGFKEFIHNGKQSVCEDTDINNKIVYLRKKRIKK